MVQDIRRLVFSPEEMLEAFQSYSRITPKFLPGGVLKSCAPEAPDGIKLVVEMEYGSATQQAEFTYRGIDALRPLILYCLETNIMLPRNGHKNFSVIDSQACVTIDLDLDVNPEGLATPLTSEHIRFIKVEEPHPVKAAAAASGHATS
ncbi:MAG: hypothetical protein KGI97_08060 [Alphaproteobacteria bacterium]|nr:hypothetical protein [Alphaproteobacteria bacterium]